MAGQIRIVNPLNCAHWDELILSHRDCSFFHSSAWARVLVESYGYAPAYFAAYHSDRLLADRFLADRLLALMPIMEVSSFLTGKRGVSLPFTDYSNPIADGSVEPQALLTQALQHGRRRGWKYLELRMGNSSFPSALPSQTYVGHTLDLTGTAEQIFSRFRSSTRRNIRKALQAGVEVTIDSSPDSIKEFYRLNCLTRKEHGLPPQPYEFFRNIGRHVLLKGFGSVILASYRGKVIAGAVFFHFGRKALYKYGASDRAYQSLRANNLVLWEAIQRYAQRGYQSLCFGRTEMENPGLRQFKSGWGTTEHWIHYYRYDFGKAAFTGSPSNVTGFHNPIFRNMPIPLLEKIGKVLYRHMG